MIVDIPSSDDFQAIGIQLLNTAWDTAASLLLDINEAEHFDVDTDEIEDAYWSAARMQLSSALSIAQQGSEFLLKAKIAEISPYLLLGTQPREWPKECSKKDTPFSSFRTIDAQDLIKVHNTVQLKKVPDEFIAEFEKLRQQRNSIMHSIDKNLSVHVKDLMMAILFINNNLGNEPNWSIVRSTYLKNTPLAQMHSEDWANQQLVREFSIVLNLLSSKALKTFFNFDKKQRAYICPNCIYLLARDAEILSKTATLSPNTPDSTTISCFVCNEIQEVDRENCSQPSCKGNVLSYESGHCLTCSSYIN